MFNPFRRKVKQSYKDDFYRVQKQLETVERISSLLISGKDVDKTLSEIAKTIPMVTKAFMVIICLWDEQTRSLKVAQTSLPMLLEKAVSKIVGKESSKLVFPSTDKNNIFIKSLEKETIITTHNIYDTTRPIISEKESKLLDKIVHLKLAISIPLIINKRRLGVISVAWDQPELSKLDQSILATFSNQAGIAIYNAQLYSETITQLSNIKQNYLDLQTIQKITTYTISTLDLKLLTQQIVDIVPEQLGERCVSAVFFLREGGEGEKFRSYAITRLPIAQRVLALLPSPPDSYLLDFEDKNYSPDVRKRIIDEKKPYLAEKFETLASPPVPPKIARAIQKLAGTKSTAFYPVIFKGEITGIMMFGLKDTPDEVSERHLALMQSVSDQIALAISNAQNYESLLQAKEELETAFVELQRLDKAKTEFLSIASHQLRTPTSVVRGYLSLLEEGIYDSDPKKKQRVIKDALLNVERLASTISDLLNAVRLEAGRLTLEPQLNDIVAVVQDVQEELQTKSLEKDIQLTVELPKQAIKPFSFDRQKVHQVLVNLLDNAIYYTHSGEVNVKLTQTPAKVIVSVKDSGIGIPEEEKDLIFTKFSRASNAREMRPDGTGIGLYLAKEIVELHGGKIWFESNSDKGTTFHFELPQR